MIFQNAIWTTSGNNSNDIAYYSSLFNKVPLVTKLLLERKLTTKEQVNDFLNPKIEGLRDPFLLTDMALAVERIESAISSRQNIWLYGDYDVDGITSIAILSKYFKYKGLKSNFYIPDRQDEGYGISESGLDSIKAAGGDLVITVDCGITAIEQARHAKKIGLDLIITDHHEFHGELPEAIAVVNPKRGDYPFKLLAGCGVALKLTQALCGDDFINFYENVIDIAALGTVADIVPLIDENRIITSLGLQRMPITKNPGIQALISEASLVGKEVNAGHIGFVIAPRINASGRIGNPSIAVEMLIEEDYYAALDIAKKLSALNAERQMQEREIMEAAEKYIQTQVNLDEDKILLIAGENWHTGIIGIVASKLSDKYSRPSIILNIDGEHAKGSARSIEGISIYEVLHQFKELFDKFGGHDQAAGLSLKTENISKLKECLQHYSRENVRHYMLISKERVDGILEPHMVTHQLIEDIEALKPFGMGNPKPQFVFNNLIIEDYKVLGKTQNHLKLVVNDGNRVYDALAFNQSSFVQFVRRSDKIHLLMTLEKNNFMGVETIQFMIKDIVKERMPIEERVHDKIHRAIFNFILNETQLCNNVKFTSIDTFDIIFSVPKNMPILIYSVDGLMQFKDLVLKNNFVNYTVHFNQIETNESREGYVDVIFMPIHFTGEQAYFYEGSTSKLEIMAHIPDRNDLAILFRGIQGKAEATIFELSLKGQFSFTKTRLCIALLVKMNLLQYEENSGFFKLNWLPKPTDKIDMDQLPLYQNLMNSWKK